MEIRETKTIKPSQKILSFLRNERERGKEMYITHRSDAGMKEIPVKPLTEFEKQMEKTRLNDGVLDEEEFEDLGKVYNQVKEYIETKHGAHFKPAQDEVKKYMDQYLQDKNKRQAKNAFNSYLNCKKIREEYMKSKMKIQQEKKRQRELQMKGIAIQENKPDIELLPRDKQLLAHFQNPYSHHPNVVNLKVNEYILNKTMRNRECQLLMKECSTMMKEQLVEPKDVQNVLKQQEKQELKVPLRKKGQTKLSLLPSEFDKTQDSIFFRTGVQYNTRNCRSQTADRQNHLQHSQRQVGTSMNNYSNTVGYGRLESRKNKRIDELDLSFYNLAEKFKIGGDETLDGTLTDYRSNNMTYNFTDTQVSPEKTTNYHFQDKSKEKDDITTTKSAQKQQNDQFVRKTIISMVTGKPVKPYLQLISLSEKIASKGTEKKQREKIKIFDENKLRGMEEFKNFLFPCDVSSNGPNMHSNMLPNFIPIAIENQLIDGGVGGGGIGGSGQRRSIMLSSTKAPRKGSIYKQSLFAGENEESDMNNQLNSDLKNKPRSISVRSNQSSILENKLRSTSNGKTDQIVEDKKDGTPSMRKSRKEIVSSFNHNSNSVKKGTPTNKIEIQRARNEVDLLNHKNNYSLENHIDTAFSKELSKYDQNYESPTHNKQPTSGQQLQNSTFSVNFRLGKFTKLVSKLKKIRNKVNFDPIPWQQMRNIEEEMNETQSHIVKQQLRKKQQMLGKQQLEIQQTRQKEYEEERAINFEKLVGKTEKLEEKLISQFEDITKSKQRKNQEFKSLIDTFQRDRPQTRQIRKKEYFNDTPQGVPQLSMTTAVNSSPFPKQKSKDHPDSRFKNMNLTLREMRYNAEEDRKKLLESNEKQVEWYMQTISKLSLLAQNDEDMTVCYFFMNQAKQVLEDGVQLKFSDFENLFAFFESSSSPELKYNSNSLCCVDLLLSLFDVHLLALSKYPKLLAAHSQQQNILEQKKNQQKA